MRLDRKTALSIPFGIGSAIVLARVGIYGVPIVILSFPLVFRRVERVAPVRLLAAFGATWFVLIAVAAPAFFGTTWDTWPIGLAALIGAAAFVVGSMWRTRSRVTET